MVVDLLGRCMKRVLVVGAGIHGLVTAIKEHLSGNQVFVLEKRKRIGGRGTSQDSHGHQIEHGPHLLLKGGPFHKMLKKISKVKPSLRPIRPNKIQIVGHGILYPANNPKELFNLKMGNDPIRTNALKLISGWGIENPVREKALLSGKLCVVGEGWAGLIGRLAAALEEVGVPVQSGVEVVDVVERGVITSKGAKIEADVVKMCDGKSNNEPIYVSTLDLVLDNKPMKGLHGLVKENVAILNLTEIHSLRGRETTHLSCINLDCNLSDIEDLLDERLSGWRSHIVTKLENKKITLSYESEFLSDGIISRTS